MRGTTRTLCGTLFVEQWGQSILMRILMLNYEFPPIGGGTGVACSHLLRELASDSEITVDLVTSGLGALCEVERLNERIAIHRLPVAKRDPQYWRPSEIARWTWRATSYTRRLVVQQPYDLCHAWAGWPSGIPAYLLRRRLPYLVALRGSDVPGFSRRLARLDALLLRRVSRRIWNGAHSVVAVSELLRDLALETRGDPPIEVIPNGVDSTRFRPSGENFPDAGADAHTVLCVGRLIERKGVEDLVLAFGSLAEAWPSAKLVVAGSGPDRPRLEALAQATAGAERIRFIGQVDHAKLPEVYRRAGIFALASRSEGMPNVVLEAMASRLPLVCTPAAAAGRMQGNGILVEAGRPESIRCALERYFADEELRRSHALRSREIAENMNWAAVAKQYLDLYERVCGARGRPAA